MIEWEKADMQMGPPIGHRIAKEEVENLMVKVNFRLISTLQLAEAFYGVVFTKSEETKS